MTKITSLAAVLPPLRRIAFICIGLFAYAVCSIANLPVNLDYWLHPSGYWLPQLRTPPVQSSETAVATAAANTTTTTISSFNATSSALKVETTKPSSSNVVVVGNNNVMISHNNTKSTTTKKNEIGLQLVLKNAEFNTRNNLADGTRICRIEDPFPVHGQPPLDLSQSLFLGMGGDGLSFNFQCDGPHYNNFTDHRLLPFLQRKQQQEEDSNWGTRPTIVPVVATNDSLSQEEANKSSSTIHILVIGNSHMRQIITTMMCQYRDQIVSIKPLPPYNKDNILLARQVTFATTTTTNPGTTTTDTNNNYLTLTILINHPAVYSAMWQENLEEILGQPLVKFDAILMGLLNRYEEKHRDSRLWQNAFQYAKDYPHHQVDLKSQSGSGVPLKDVVHAYAATSSSANNSSSSGRRPIIIYMSSMAVYNIKRFRKGEELLHRLQQQNAPPNSKQQLLFDYYTINARKHLNEPEFLQHNGGGGHSGECGSDEKNRIVDCEHKSPNSHRCTGKKGSEPDLIVYDLINALWTIFS